jgi:hypothetical protein
MLVINSGNSIKQPLDRPQDRIKKSPFTRKDARQKDAQRLGNREHQT